MQASVSLKVGLFILTHRRDAEGAEGAQRLFNKIKNFAPNALFKGGDIEVNQEAYVPPAQP